MKLIQVAYHAHCPDGILAAAVFKHLIASHLPEGMLEIIPISYSNETETIKQMSERAALNKESSNIVDIIFLDYCPNRGDYVNFLAMHNVLIVDHHIDRVDEISKSHSPSTVILSNGTFPNADQPQAVSGAALTLFLIIQLLQSNSTVSLDMTYINQVVLNPTQIQLQLSGIPENIINLVDLVSDYDTWTLKLVDSPAAFNGLGIYAAECNWNLEEVVNLLSSTANDSVRYLKTLYTGMSSQIKGALSRSFNYPSDENPLVTYVNAPTSLASEIGRVAFLESNTSVVFVYSHNLKAGRMDISIRTADNTPINAIELAKVFNGGGHQNAAGCRLAITENIPGFILGDLQLQLMAAVVSQIQNPRNNMS